LKGLATVDVAVLARITSEELREGLRNGLPAGIADLLLNFAPVLIAGILPG